MAETGKPAAKPPVGSKQPLSLDGHQRRHPVNANEYCDQLYKKLVGLKAGIESLSINNLIARDSPVRARAVRPYGNGTRAIGAPGGKR
jgi:hypothetical protein